jgi:hypothetical protein
MQYLDHAENTIILMHIVAISQQQPLSTELLLGNGCCTVTCLAVVAKHQVYISLLF